MNEAYNGYEGMQNAIFFVQNEILFVQNATFSITNLHTWMNGEAEMNYNLRTYDSHQIKTKNGGTLH